MAGSSKGGNLSVLQGLADGQVGVVVGGDLQDVHRLLSVWLRQLVYDVQQLLQLGLKHLKAEKVIMITIAVEKK